MAPEVGRQVDYVLLPDGREVSPYTAMTPVEAFPAVAQFEMLQDEVSRVLVRVVPAPGWDASSADALRAEVEPVLPGIAIDVETVDQILPQRGGKYRIVRSRVERTPSG